MLSGMDVRLGVHASNKRCIVCIGVRRAAYSLCFVYLLKHVGCAVNAEVALVLTLYVLFVCSSTWIVPLMLKLLWCLLLNLCLRMFFRLVCLEMEDRGRDRKGAVQQTALMLDAMCVICSKPACNQQRKDFILHIRCLLCSMPVCSNDDTLVFAIFSQCL